jgi:putative membrane protein
MTRTSNICYRRRVGQFVSCATVDRLEYPVMNRNRLLTLTLAGLLLGQSGMAAGKLDDATILAIFDQANAADIYTGRLGAKYGQAAEVRALGRMVATDHVAVQQLGRDLASKLGIVPTPPDNDTSVVDHAKAVAQLQSKSAAEFDAAYLRYEIGYHQAVIDAVKGTLLPAIANPELKALVGKVLPGFEHHLAATKAAAVKLGVK